MALNLKAIREALAAQISQGTGREVHAYAYPPGSPGEMPAVVIRAGEEYINYFVTLGDDCDVSLILDIIANARVSLEDGLIVLDELLSVGAGLPNSVFDAITADRTLGGAVDACELGVVGQHVGTGIVEDGRPPGVMVSVPLSVWVARS
jgi:hypothetical protein